MKPSVGSLLLAWCWCIAGGLVAVAQPPIESLSGGFKRFQQGRLTLITDLPIDDELRSWPEVLDQAIAIWTDRWRVDPAQSQAWRLTAYLIGDRKRFMESGLAPQVPPFEDGYQLRDTVFLIEQPSIYYRRHLFLHEATHWAMYRGFGGAGSPWFMEGMADLYGTHRWSDRKLALGILPSSPGEVPQWGRFKRLHAMLARDDIPSLRQILNYTNESGDRMDRYVWSWAACVFFMNHPHYKDAFAAASEPPLDYSMSLSQKLSASLEPRWPWVVAEWNGFLSDFDFGYVPARSMPRLDENAFQLMNTNSHECDIDAARGWQGTGIRVRRGETLRLTAEGKYQVGVGANGKPWVSEPPGITIRYVSHQPLGRLLATIVPGPEAEATRRWEPMAIGRGGGLTSETDGFLLLKVNDAAGELGDNQGVLRVRIQKSGP
ncbi:MAG: hypothetical protein ACK553_02405 [Planctomycetota bacterium]|jgi:hypothetical protein